MKQVELAALPGIWFNLPLALNMDIAGPFSEGILIAKEDEKDLSKSCHARVSVGEKR